MHLLLEAAPSGEGCDTGVPAALSAVTFWYNILLMKFEDNLKELETLVAKMEGGELDLDGMIAAFERGQKLVETCQQSLASIRQRIEKVTKAGTTEELKV